MANFWMTIFIVSLLFLGAAKGNLHRTAIVNGMAELKCNFKIPNNHSRESFVIYWQRNEEVVFAMDQGKVDINSVTENFRNNTKVLLWNGDLQLYNISLRHTGKYQCRVLERGSWLKKIHESEFQLDIIANYTIPEISSGYSLVEVENGATVPYRCTAGHGYPKPKNMFWMLFYANRTEKNTPPPEITNTSETFNISINLLWRVNEDVNITCSLEAHHNAVSEVLQIKMKKDVPPAAFDWKIIIAVAVSVAVILIALAVWGHKRYRRARKNADQEMGQTTADSKAANPTETCELMSVEPEPTTAL